MYLRQEELVGVFAGLDALASQPSDLLSDFWRVFGLADGDEQLPELGHQTVQLANHLKNDTDCKRIKDGDEIPDDVAAAAARLYPFN